MTASGFRTFVFVLGALSAGALAQAQQAPQTSGATSAAAATSQPAQKAAGNKAAVAKPVKTAAAQQSDADARLIKDARNAGFKPTHVRGTLMFCRTARELGSNFPVRTCYDAQQVQIKIHEYQTERNQLEQMHGTGLRGN